MSASKKKGKQIENNVVLRTCFVLTVRPPVHIVRLVRSGAGRGRGRGRGRERERERERE